MPTLTEEKPARLPLQERGLYPAPGVARSLVARGPFAEKSALFALAILILYATARNICQALVRPLRYDEICTTLMVQQEHFSRLWQALAHGADSPPFFFFMVERAMVAVIHNENLAYRGVSILGFAITLLCLFIAVRKRNGAAIALVCAAIPLTTVLFDMLAVEARGYSMLVACITFAFVCYQRVPARRWVILMGLSLVLAESFHYFAAFAFVPFILAEAAYFAMTRQFRRGVWIALLSGFMPLAFFWPILSATNRIFGPHFWAIPTFEAARDCYSWYFLSSEPSLGLYLAAAAAVGVLFTILVRLRATSRSERPPGAPVHELALALGFLSLPLIGFAAAALAHGGMHAKYLVSSLLGFTLALGFTLPRLPRWGSLLPSVCATLLLCVIVPRERLIWSMYTGQLVSPATFVEDFVSAGGHADLPVVISDSHDFLELQHYSNKQWQQRFVMLVDAEQEVTYAGSDTASKHLGILRQYTTLPIYDFQAFLAEHPAFLVYSSNGGLDRDWWPGRLKKDGFKLQNVSVRPRELNDYYHRVILVTR